MSQDHIHSCDHCGLPCNSGVFTLENKQFCCRGCQTVFELLSENDLCEYYSLNERPGSSLQNASSADQFAYLEDEDLLERLLHFRGQDIAKVTLFIPNMHCSSCIWLLEQLQRLDNGILQSRVDFLRKQLAISFNPQLSSLRKIVTLLSAIGYEPRIAMDDMDQKPVNPVQRSLYIKIGVAGFAFGNIMLLSFPEYLSISTSLHQQFKDFFGYLNILLALPVLFYSATDYLQSAWKGIRHRTINIDVPLSLGILTFFARSLYEILSGSGAGYMDSFAGLVFLLLIGKLFQQKTFDTLSFERDYKSFFPIAITRKNGDAEQQVPLSKLELGDRIVIRHQELIPADAVLLRGKGSIDYSFVTGEADPIAKKSGDTIYAGGRQAGGRIELEIVKAVSQSYLTQLWNNDAFRKPDSHITEFANAVSRYFTVAILSIAFAAAIFWFPLSSALAINAFTAVLIIACPCALALSTPFTLGSALRIYSRMGFYLKNTTVIEILAKATHVVFDKTGTLTRAGKMSVSFEGETDLDIDEKAAIRALSSHSLHPLSRAVYQHYPMSESREMVGFKEVTGSGIEATIDGQLWQLGSAAFTGCQSVAAENKTIVYLSVDGVYRGHFLIHHAYRSGMGTVLDILKKRLSLSLLSGDNDRESRFLTPHFGENAHLRFQQSPQDKLHYVEMLQSKGEKVVMIGDGLNDAGALAQSDVGISISEDLNSFSPACDAILEADQFERLPRLLSFSKDAMRVVYLNFAVSLIYNAIGISFAVQGTLSPLICAILMPLSSITAIIISSVATHFLAARYQFLGVAKEPVQMPKKSTAALHPSPSFALEESA